MAKKPVQGPKVRELGLLERATKKDTRSAAEMIIDGPPELLAAVPELLAVRDEGVTIRDFIASLTPFFTRARDIEVAAKDRLEQAKKLTQPKNAEEDAAIVRFIQASSAENKAACDHWGITSLVFAFQRRLTAARNRSRDRLEQAGKIAQQHHNAFVAAEKRRVEEENRRRQDEADRKAREERDAELKRLEELALKAEAESAELSDREKAFANFIVMGYHQENAARQAGYKDPGKMGARLMTYTKILDAIESIQQAAALRKQAEAKKAAPIMPEEIVEEKVQTGGGIDRTTKSAEITDAQAFIDAVCEGKHGIPRDTLEPSQKILNVYARQMGELLNRWPGIRLKKGTTTV